MAADFAEGIDYYMGVKGTEILKQVFSPTKTAKMRNEIASFTQTEFANALWIVGVLQGNVEEVPQSLVFGMDANPNILQRVYTSN